MDDIVESCSGDDDDEGLEAKIMLDILINPNMDLCIQISQKDDAQSDRIYLFVAWNDDNFDPRKIDSSVLIKMSE